MSTPPGLSHGVAEHEARESQDRHRESHFDDLQHLIEHLAHLLPSQGPITVFVHHNTLHAFEDLKFEDGLKDGHQKLGCEPYLSEREYRQCLTTGRIRQDELVAVIREDLGDQAETLIGILGTRFSLRMAMLEYPLQTAPSTELRWLVEETDALRRFRSFVHGPTRLRTVAETRHWVMRDLRNGNDTRHICEVSDDVRRDVRELTQLFGRTSMERWSNETWESLCLHLLWRICLRASQQVEAVGHGERAEPLRHAELLHRATNEVCDELVNEVLIRFCASFLDQGYANWPLPDRENGFFAAFVSVYGNRPGPPDRWLRGLHAELDGIGQRGLSPLESIEESLRLLGVSSVEREQYLLQTLQALPGWGGMIWQMETNAEWTLRPAPAGTLVGFLAVRLILDRLAVAHAARQSIGWTGSLGDLRAELRRRLPATSAPHCEQRAFLAFQLSQVCGWLPQQLQRLPIQQWQMLMRELDMFSNLERRRVLHRAYERRYRNQVLDALIIHSRDRRSWAHESAVSRTDAPAWRLSSPHEIKEVDRNGHATTTRPNDAIPSFQIITCIDDREESFRRHLEEIDPACETFGAAGFFGVAMYYRGASDAHPRPLCPVIIKPQHYVNEEVEHTFVREHKRRAEMRRVLGTASHQVHLGSRTFFGGLLTGLTGTLASIPLVTRILFPRSTAQLRSAFAGFLRPPTVTKLALERSQPTPGPEPGHVGYSLDEMSNIVERLLRDIGLLQHFAPIVVMCGHGSSSLNNPHESAYNCGACSGGRGGPNARAFAEMANDPRVRNRLSEQGLNIPNDSVFVGAYHNTCDDSVTFFDLERVPVSHRQQFQHICDLIDEARRRDAHERCRRFESAPLSLTPEAALKHVEGRSEDLSQARPEYNHATNALCLVGHRWWSRNLFLDRRAFLQSYDPSTDDDHQTLLTRILSAVIPVCAGISLEYYFSCVDNVVLGCGSKLPHNIASLLGVMEGAASDLRPGLSQQMIEIHEPMRILFVIETRAEAMLSIMDRVPVIGRLCRNEWVQLAVMDPDSHEVQVYANGRFKPYRLRFDTLPSVATSADWYRGWRDHLGLASVREPQPTKN